jgi:hypothetical protein
MKHRDLNSADLAERTRHDAGWSWGGIFGAILVGITVLASIIAYTPNMATGSSRTVSDPSTTAQGSDAPVPSGTVQ